MSDALEDVVKGSNGDLVTEARVLLHDLLASRPAITAEDVDRVLSESIERDPTGDWDNGWNEGQKLLADRIKSHIQSHGDTGE